MQFNCSVLCPCRFLAARSGRAFTTSILRNGNRIAQRTENITMICMQGGVSGVKMRTSFFLGISCQSKLLVHALHFDIVNLFRIIAEMVSWNMSNESSFCMFK